MQNWFQTVPLPCLALLGTALGLMTPAVAADRALLIGIDAYEAPWRLTGARNDVERIRQTLVDHMGFAQDDILVLPEERSTKPGIEAALRTWLRDGTAPGDRAFVYFAGHGTQVPDLNGDETADGRDEALALIGFDPAQPEAAVLTDDDMARLLAELRDRRVTLVVDAGHAGSVQDTVSGRRTKASGQARFIPMLDPLTGADTPELRASLRSDTAFGAEVSTASAVEVWTASAAYQAAWETDGAASGGVFTAAFAAAHDDPKADLNGNGRLSRGEILAYVRDQSRAFCEMDDPCKMLSSDVTPMLSVPTRARSLSVAAWPDDPALTPASPVTETGNTAKKPAQAPEQAGPSVDEMLDILVGGGVPAELRLRHAKRDTSGPIGGGDRVVFEILSPQGGQVILLDLRDDGLVHQLFPSKIMGKNTPATPNRALVIPDVYGGIEFRMPPGTGALVAIIASDPGLIDALAMRNTTLAPLSDPIKELGNLMEELTQTWSQEGENRRSRFGIARLSYTAN